MTTKARNILIISSVALIVLFLGLLGTYLSHGNDWKAVLHVITLPQCIIFYISAVGAGICALIHYFLRRK